MPFLLFYPFCQNLDLAFCHDLQNLNDRGYLILLPCLILLLGCHIIRLGCSSSCQFLCLNFSGLAFHELLLIRFFTMSSCKRFLAACLINRQASDSVVIRSWCCGLHPQFTHRNSSSASRSWNWTITQPWHLRQRRCLQIAVKSWSGIGPRGDCVFLRVCCWFAENSFDGRVRWRPMRPPVCSVSEKTCS